MELIKITPDDAFERLKKYFPAYNIHATYAWGEFIFGQAKSYQFYLADKCIISHHECFNIPSSSLSDEIFIDRCIRIAQISENANMLGNWNHAIEKLKPTDKYQILLINSFPVEQEIEKIVSVGGYKYTGRGEQFIDPAVRPINDNDLPNSKAEYDKVGDEIYRLRDEKQKVQLDIIGRDELKKRIDDMSEFLKGQPTALIEYDEALIRRLIEKVTVFEDKFTVEFKSGMTVDVNE